MPFNTLRWSTRLSRTSRPWARNSSSLASVVWMKECSWSAWCSRRVEFGSDAGVRKGDSECCKDVGGAKRLRASDADGDWMPDGVPRSSLRWEAALCGTWCGEQASSGRRSVPRSLCVQTGSLGRHSLRETFARAWRVVS